MPANKNALIRYKTIDTCLQNRARRWLLNDLLEACSEALYEYEGISEGLSLRSVQSDIQVMRSEKLGYEAPIVVVDKKYYTYSDPEYSITKKPLSPRDLQQLGQINSLLKQFKGFRYFDEMSTLMRKLEDKIVSEHHKSKPIIYFEKNDHLKGLSFLDQLWKAILEKKVVQIHYQSFAQRRPLVFVFHPWYLKEFRNRWYVFGRHAQEKVSIVNLALDRMHLVQVLEREPYEKDENFDLEEYLEPVIGVTVLNVPYEFVHFIADKQTAPYIETKPLHSSQQMKSFPNGETQFTLRIKVNFELEKELLSFGEHITVLAPLSLKERIEGRLRKAVEGYGRGY
jgi:predicted DNA-binding transcriptional regulator YafY